MDKCCEWFKKEKYLCIKGKGYIYFYFCPNCGENLQDGPIKDKKES